MDINTKTFDCFTGCGEKITIIVTFMDNIITFVGTTNGSQLTQLFCTTLNAITIKQNETNKLGESFWNQFSLPIHGSRKENLVACLECIKKNIL